MASHRTLSIPSFLASLPQAPKQLFAWGLEPPTKPCLAIVGSRTPSQSGARKAYELAHDLAKSGLVIVSGLARGIDAAAHQGALDAGGHTIGFMGCGIDLIYPRSSRPIYEKIRRSGTLISEYEAGYPPQAFCFVARNRLIAAWAKGVVVVEAGEKSGALITADLATQLSRDVFAVPGDCYRGTSVGSNRLIRDGAHVVLDARDVLATPGWLEVTGEPVLGAPAGLKQPPGLSSCEAEIWSAIHAEGSLTLVDLCDRVRGSSDAVLAAVTTLELMGHLKRDSGGLSLATIS